MDVDASGGAVLIWPSWSVDLRASIGSFDYSASLQRIWRDVIDAANRYIQETEPFKLAKTDLDRCRVVLINLAEWLRVAAILIKPFLAAHRRDVLPGVQFRRSSSVGPGELPGRDRTATADVA